MLGFVPLRHVVERAGIECPDRFYAELGPALEFVRWFHRLFLQQKWCGVTETFGGILACHDRRLAWNCSALGVKRGIVAKYSVANISNADLSGSFSGIQKTSPSYENIHGHKIERSRYPKQFLFIAADDCPLRFR